MACAENNHQFFVVTHQFLERIFTKIAGVRLFAVNDESGTFDFVRTCSYILDNSLPTIYGK